MEFENPSNNGDGQPAHLAPFDVRARASKWVAQEPGLPDAVVSWYGHMLHRRESFHTHAEGVARFGGVPPFRALRHVAALGFAQLEFLARELPRELSDRRFLSEPSAWAKETSAKLIRTQLAQLGPSAAEVARLIDMAEGILPQVIVDTFRERPIVSKPISSTTVDHIVRREFGDAVAKFDPDPISVNPISQLHDAWLQGGREVHLRVRRPGVSRALRADARILSTIAAPLEQFIPFFTEAHPVGFLQLATRQTMEEVDLRNQALNAVELALALESMEIDLVRIPHPIPGLSTRHALVVERLEGKPLVESTASIDIQAAVASYAAATVESALARGVFHADLLSEHLVVTPDAKLGIISCGTLGRFDLPTRRGALQYLTGFFTGDFNAQVEAMASLGAVPDDVDKELLVQDLASKESLGFASLMMGGPDGITNALRDAVGILLDHKVRPPLEAVLFVRNVFSFNRFAQHFDPEASAVALLMPTVQRLPQIALDLQS